MKNNYTIGLIFGGKSTEHHISMESAKNIFTSYTKEQLTLDFKIKPFYVDQEGFWYNSQYSEYLLSEGKEEGITSRHKKPSFIKDIDIWFPMIHGSYGEDGELQKLLEKTEIPYIGTNSLYSLKCFDKVLSRQTAAYENIQQPAFFWFDCKNVKSIQMICDFIQENIELPCFIKPSRTGSSIGISKIVDYSDIPKALKKAAEKDSRIIIEQGIEDCMELEIAILGRRIPRFSKTGTIAYNDAFYTEAAKYNDEHTKIIIPAKINRKIEMKLVEYSKKLFNLFNLRDFCRIDFFYDTKNSQLFWNEINTIPGFTKRSMFQMLWEQEQMSLIKVIEQIVKNAFK